ncbi:hypothetical protein KUTeg_021567 [Tegillarca granosa]|uniref:Uncharacterized protein n=1 Tax=Tegillarca granosa TaxID=220873 RepID=A0ABQ9E3N9_TEGGR|nr:hypothetical protein KUTeg_021567 [Tegillarca granosa]
MFETFGNQPKQRVKTGKISRSINGLNKSVIEKLQLIKNNWTWLPAELKDRSITQLYPNSEQNIISGGLADKTVIHLTYHLTNCPVHVIFFGLEAGCTRTKLLRDGDEDWVHNILLPNLWISPVCASEWTLNLINPSLIIL